MDDMMKVMMDGMRAMEQCITASLDQRFVNVLQMQKKLTDSINVIQCRQDTMEQLVHTNNLMATHATVAPLGIYRGVGSLTPPPPVRRTATLTSGPAMFKTSVVSSVLAPVAKKCK